MNIHCVTVAALSFLLIAVPAAAHEAPVHVHQANGAVIYLSAALAAGIVALITVWILYRRLTGRGLKNEASKRTGRTAPPADFH